MRMTASFLLATMVWLGSAEGALRVGDTAPALSVEQWIGGQPVDPAGPAVSVVVFWGTYSAASREVAPLLSQLQEAYRERGARVVAICAEPSGDLESYRAAERPAFTLAAEPAGRAGAAWLEGVAGIPYAFVVREGRILWRGHPFAGLDAALDRILAGRYDLEKARQADRLMEQLLQADGPDAALARVEELIRLDPAEARYREMQLDLLTQKNDKAGARRAREAWVAALPPTPENLNQLAWVFSTHEDVRQRDLSLAFRLARRAVDLSGGNHPAILDTLARVYFEIGMIDKALELQRKALGLATDEAMKSDLRIALDYFESAEAARKEAQ